MCNSDIPFSYLEWLVATKKYIDGLDKNAIGELELLHQLMAACYSKMLPSLPKEKYFDFSKSVKFHQMWAAYDQDVFSLIQDTQITDEQDVLTLAKKGTPYIFCTYHIGSYRMLNSILAINDIEYSLVTDSQYIKEQGDKAKELFKTIKKEFLQKDAELDILDAESPSIGLQAIRRLRNGTSLLFYIDGNTGVNNDKENKDNFARINFLNTPYYARKGIAYLSFVSETPIIPVVSIRTGWLNREIYVLPSIKANDTESREQFCYSATQKLYDILAEYLKKYPEQWESWIYVYKSIDTEEENNIPPPYHPITDEEVLKLPLVFNKDEYELINFGNQQVLFEKNTLKIHAISNQFYEVLSSFGNPEIIEDFDFSTFSVSEQAIRELVERKILIIST
jgi:KDO2-lipid IV(A) lauroyltransferase